MGISIEHQISLSAADTICSKRNFERLWMNHGVLVQRYRANNGVFSSAAFEKEIRNGSQTIDHVQRCWSATSEWSGRVS